MKVVYGHTDSIYVQIDDVETAQKVCTELNEHVRTLFPNLMDLDQHPVTLEFEKFYKALGVGCIKNRNAGFISWKDGEWLAEPEFVVTGYSMKRISSTPLTREVQERTLRMWAEERTEAEIVAYLKGRYNDAIHGRLSMEEMIARGRVKGNRMRARCSAGLDCPTYHFDELCQMPVFKEREHGLVVDSYRKCVSCGHDLYLETLEGKNLSIKDGIKGVCYYNSTHENAIDDSFLFMKIQPEGRTFIHPGTGKRVAADYVSVHEMTELDEYKPDWRYYGESIVKKAKPIFEAMNWDVNQVKTDGKIKSLDDWW